LDLSGIAGEDHAGVVLSGGLEKAEHLAGGDHAGFIDNENFALERAPSIRVLKKAFDSDGIPETHFLEFFDGGPAGSDGEDLAASFADASVNFLEGESFAGARRPAKVDCPIVRLENKLNGMGPLGAFAKFLGGNEVIVNHGKPADAVVDDSDHGFLAFQLGVCAKVVATAKDLAGSLFRGEGGLQGGEIEPASAVV
jgi:hypothetical protein